MQSDLLAESDRAPGFAAFMQAIFEASLPPSELKKSRSWISTAPRTKHAALRPSMSNRTVMERYAKKFRVGRIEGLHHIFLRWVLYPPSTCKVMRDTGSQA